MASSQSRIRELSEAIATHSRIVDDHLSENNLPQPSFDADGPSDLSLPPAIEESRGKVLTATQELNDLLQGPRNLLFNHEVQLLCRQKL